MKVRRSAVALGSVNGQSGGRARLEVADVREGSYLISPTAETAATSAQNTTRAFG